MASSTDRPRTPDTNTNQTPDSGNKKTTPVEKRAPGEAEEMNRELEPADQNPAPKE